MVIYAGLTWAHQTYHIPWINAPAILPLNFTSASLSIISHFSSCLHLTNINFNFQSGFFIVGSNNKTGFNIHPSTQDHTILYDMISWVANQVNTRLIISNHYITGFQPGSVSSGAVDLLSFTNTCPEGIPAWKQYICYIFIISSRKRTIIMEKRSQIKLILIIF